MYRILYETINYIRGAGRNKILSGTELRRYIHAEYKGSCSKGMPIQYLYCTLSDKEEIHIPGLELSSETDGEDDGLRVGQGVGGDHHDIKRALKGSGKRGRRCET